MAATTSVPSNRELVRQVGFPVWILPIITVSSQFLHFLMAVPFHFVFLWIDQRPVTTAAAALPLVMALQGLFILALAYFVSAFQVFFHDTRHLLGITLTLMFYMTPVFYHLDAVPPGYTLLFELNPMVHLLTAYRAILIGGELPAVAPLAAVGAGSTVLVIVGRRLFIRLRYRFVQEL
jgi:lipopolysaccharide transport system permease protein